MKILQTLSCAALLAVVGLKNASTNLNAVDTAGRGDLEVVVGLTSTDVNITAIKVVESDDNVTFTDVPGGAIATPPVVADAGKLYAIHVDLLGRKRYIKPVVTAAAGTNGANLAVAVVLGDSRVTPNDAPSRGFAGEVFC